MIIFDLDGTLANIDHRRHFVDPSKNENYEYSNFGKDPITRECVCDANPRWHRKDNWDIKFKPDWKAFYNCCDEDKPNQPVIEMWDNRISLGMMGVDQVWSGRCESVRQKTIQWLDKHLVCFEEHQLKMRPIGDSTPDDQLKERWLDEAVKEGKKIDFVFDDRKKVCDMYRRRGIFVFCVNQTGEVF